MKKYLFTLKNRIQFEIYVHIKKFFIIIVTNLSLLDKTFNLKPFWSSIDVLLDAIISFLSIEFFEQDVQYVSIKLIVIFINYLTIFGHWHRVEEKPIHTM